MRTFHQRLGLLGVLILASRIPFLFDGFGSEEDAWALPMVAERIALTGIYEVSRLPGHPVQEIVYSWLYASGPVLFNLLTALLSTTGICAFAAMLRNYGHSSPLWVAAVTAFTPVVYINSTNAMDYTWAMGFVLLAGYFISRKQVIPAGCFTGLAVGCRITSGAMVLPYALLLWYTTDKQKRTTVVMPYILSSLLVSGITYLPVYLEYGLSFFTYYEHFPLPGLLKNVYKGTIAVWGLTGILALMLSTAWMLTGKTAATVPGMQPAIKKALLRTAALVIILYTISFMRVPLKSAFMIPLVPFTVLLMSLFLHEKHFRITGIMIMSASFILGINLAEANRGSAVSPLAVTTSLSGQKIAIDPLQGLVLADRSKRLQRTAFAKKVLSTTQQMAGKKFIIAGWWLADLQYLSKNSSDQTVLYRYYTDEPELQWYQSNGYQIYYLDDQAALNDLRFGKRFTTRYAKKLIIE